MFIFGTRSSGLAHEDLLQIRNACKIYFCCV